MKAIFLPLIDAARAFGHGVKAANAIRHNVTPDHATTRATAWTLPRPEAEYAHPRQPGPAR